MAFSILGCPHRRVSFPIVTKDDAAVDFQSGEREARQPHVTCLECGKEFWYDWQRMRRAGEKPATSYQAQARRVAA